MADWEEAYKKLNALHMDPESPYFNAGAAGPSAG